VIIFENPCWERGENWVIAKPPGEMSYIHLSERAFNEERFLKWIQAFLGLDIPNLPVWPTLDTYLVLPIGSVRWREQWPWLPECWPCCLTSPLPNCWIVCLLRYLFISCICIIVWFNFEFSNENKYYKSVIFIKQQNKV
jgi:hypothetical protein